MHGLQPRSSLDRNAPCCSEVELDLPLGVEVEERAFSAHLGKNERAAVGERCLGAVQDMAVGVIEL